MWRPGDPAALGMAAAFTLCDLPGHVGKSGSEDSQRMTNKAPTLPPLSEKEFQRQVLDLAGILEWSVYHSMLAVDSRSG